MKYIVTVNNKKYEVDVIDTTKEIDVNSSISKENTVNISLEAPMPGTIIDIKVSEGDVVKKGDTLFILEAMKMENEITAPENGTIKEISALKGSSVNTGDVLAKIQ